MRALFFAILRRELRLAARRPRDAWLPVAILAVAASLFPLAARPEPQTLRVTAPGIARVGALLATMLSVQHLYAGDHADGSLDQMLLAPQPALVLVLAKSAAHWLVHGLPLIDRRAAGGADVRIAGRGAAGAGGRSAAGDADHESAGRVGCSADARVCAATACS